MVYQRKTGRKVRWFNLVTRKGPFQYGERPLRFAKWDGNDGAAVADLTSFFVHQRTSLLATFQ